MQLPEQLLQSLATIKSFDKNAFEQVHQSGEQVTSIRINPKKWLDEDHEREGGESSRDSYFKSRQPIGWTEYGYYFAGRPSFTFDPLFHAGCYYVQEASSMFLEQAIQQTIDLSQPLKVLDLSAAPGGKSTHIQSLVSRESLLVSNEVIRSRANILKDNIIKWGCNNVVVTNNDPKDFSAMKNYFDVLVVDAPCSGSGLFRREPEAINEWSENNVTLCSQRQQRILADVFPSLKKDGILIYSTCSYSKEEDEKIAEWLLNTLPVEYCPLTIDPAWNIAASEKGYRFWPDKVKGEGFYIACFKKTDGIDGRLGKIKTKTIPASKKEIEMISRWVKANDHELVKNENTVYAWPNNLAGEMNLILSTLKVMYSGVRLGEIMRDKFIPDHPLAMSDLSLDSIGRLELSYDQAIQYLQRKDLRIEDVSTGWQLASFKNHALGWVNVLSNRINNYYPKELRILRELKSPPM